MTAQKPDTLINRHPRVQFNGLKLYGVVRGDIHQEGNSGWGDEAAYRTKAVVPENVVRRTDLHRGYVATFVLEQDGRLRLRSFKFTLNSRTSQTQRVNEFIEGDFWVVLKPKFFAERTYVPFRDGIIIEDRQQWFVEESYKLQEKRRAREFQAWRRSTKIMQAQVREIAHEITNDLRLREMEWWPALQSVHRRLELYAQKKDATSSSWKRLALAIADVLIDNAKLKDSPIGQKLLELSTDIETTLAN